MALPNLGYSSVTIMVSIHFVVRGFQAPDVQESSNLAWLMGLGLVSGACIEPIAGLRQDIFLVSETPKIPESRVSPFGIPLGGGFQSLSNVGASRFIWSPRS